MNESGLKEWEEVEPSPSPSHSQPHQHHAHKEWEMLDGDDFSIFPPSSHEGLFLLSSEAASAAEVESPPPPPSSQHQPSSSVYRVDDRELQLPRQSPPSISRLLVFARRRLEVGFQLVCSRLHLLLRRPFTPTEVWSSAAATAALMGLLFYVWRWQRRRRALAMERDSLLLLVRDKDEKISQLMHQIVEMNKVLSAYRRIPVLRGAHGFST